MESWAMFSQAHIRLSVSTDHEQSQAKFPRIQSFEGSCKKPCARKKAFDCAKNSWRRNSRGEAGRQESGQRKDGMRYAAATTPRQRWALRDAEAATRRREGGEEPGVTATVLPGAVKAFRATLLKTHRGDND
ncbi:hypothetical protein KM043_016324 [Ampulex compressa]|nr:hypothetical protein KM043_016324 [Ampulex compressa]